MSAKFDLTQGPILHKLIKMALPIMATSFVQMAFNLSDMFWLSLLGDDAVAAVGTAGQFVWLSMAFIWIGRMGAQIGVSQSMGRHDAAAAEKYAQNSFFISIVLGVVYMVVLLLFSRQLIGFFNLDNPLVVNQAVTYLTITGLAMPFFFTNQVITGVFIGFGNTKIPFIINSAGLILNIGITPIFIFALDMGIAGAAVGTLIAAVLNLSAKIWAMKLYKGRPFENYKIFRRPEGLFLKRIFRWGIPMMTESAAFTLLFMVVSRFVAEFGYGAVAAQRVGTQVESLAWMMAGGFSSAFAAFIGQNYGAQKFDRMKRAYKISIISMGGYGIFIGIVLFAFARPMIGIFLDEPAYIAMGVDYLRVFALTQLIYCMEQAAAGSFQGQGLTYKPTIVSVSSNVIRVILAYIVVTFTDFGIFGIWVAIAISMTIRGIWMLTWHFAYTRRREKAAYE